MIDVKFGTEELPNVTSIQLSSSFGSVVDQATGKAFRFRRIVVSGFVRKRGRDALAVLQKDTENTFAGLGPSTFSYPGIDAIEAKMVDWEWEDWAGNPIIRYTATFETEVSNPFSRTVSVVQVANAGSKTFDPSPAVSDSFANSDPIDELPSATKDKKISLKGALEGTTAEVDAEEVALRDLLVGDEFFTVTIPSGAYVCKVSGFTFDTPSDRDGEDATKDYSIDFVTLPDFTLEARALQGGSLSVAGITFDVASSFSHSIQRDNAGGITSETLNVSGKKQFGSLSEAETFKATVEALVNAGATYTSATGKVLKVTSVNWSAPVRDAHATDGTKRYALGFSTSLSIDPTAGGTVTAPSGIVLGVNFAVIESRSFGGNLTDDGSLTSKTKSASGKVLASNLPTIRPGDSVFEDGSEFFITSLNIGNLDDSGRFQVSVSGTTLDTEDAIELLFPQLFQGFFLDHVESENRSISFQLDDCDNLYKATSISASVSGFKIGTNGNVLNLIQAVNRFPNTFIITNVSTGAPERKVVDDVVQLRYPISISGTLNLTPNIGACGAEADVREETEISTEDATTQYAKIPIPGKGVVYKKVGLNPAIQTISVRKVAKNRSIFSSMSIPADPSSTLTGGNVAKISRKTNESGLTKSVTCRFQVFTDAVEE